MSAVGRGNATISEDGCPVEIYAALPPAGEADIVHAAVPTGAAVLELGCGTGRIADPLARLGHRVVGVDSCQEMLAHLRDAEPVHAHIEHLDLAERFGGVLLASNLVNTADPEQRAGFLDAAARHLSPDGVVVIERHAPIGTSVAGPASWQAGPVRLELRDVVYHGGGLVSATVLHRLSELIGEQDFTTQVLDDTALNTALTQIGLHLGTTLTPDRRWVTAQGSAR